MIRKEKYTTCFLIGVPTYLACSNCKVPIENKRERQIIPKYKKPWDLAKWGRHQVKTYAMVSPDLQVIYIS